MSCNYVLIGKRWLRKYTASKATPVYAAESEVSRLTNSLCGVKWQRVSPIDARMTYHTNDVVYYDDPVEKTGGVTGLDYNVMIRDEFDAALFCGNHVSETHIVYGNAACYKFVLPDMQTYPTLERLKVDITSDPYNSTGARIAIYTNSTGDIPVDCDTCRTGSAPSASHSCTHTGNSWTTNDTYADSVAPRATREVIISGKTTTNWYPVNGTCEFTPASGLQLQKYLFVFVLLENYNISRGNWIEGCSFITNRVSIQTSGDVTGWTNNSTVDLSSDSIDAEEIGSSSVYVVKDGVVPDVVGDKSPFVGITVLESGTVPRMLDGKIVSTLPQIIDEESSGNLCAGISTATGLFARGEAEPAGLVTTNPTFKNLGAGYCIHHSSDLKFVDKNGNEANPKSLCVTAASLMVPFGLDGGVEMSYAKFDWSSWLRGAVTPTGAKLNFWMKVGSFEKEYPDLTNASFYRADENSVDGWKLIASESVSSGSATVDLSQEIGRVASGNNTFLVTAYVPASSVSISDTSDFSNGVGTFWYNAVTPDANLSIDVDIYPTFDPSASYPKGCEISYGTNHLREWNVCPGTTGMSFVKTTKSQYRRLAFCSTGIKYSDDGVTWNSSNITIPANTLKEVYEVNSIAVAVFGDSAYATSNTYGQKDGRLWDTVKNLGSTVTCADRLSKGMLVGTTSGAYRVQSNGYSASDWAAVTMPSVPVRDVSVIPNSFSFNLDSQLFATDKCLYYSANSGGDLAIASLPTSLKCTHGAFGSGSSRIFTDSGLFTKSSDVWIWTGLTGDVRYVNASSSPWVACVDNGLAYSTNSGISWTMSSATGKFLGIAYYNGVWVATGEGVMSWSLDGMTWNAVEGVEGTCNLAIHVDPYWYVGFSGGKVYISESGRDWTLQEYTSAPSGVYRMYETDQGKYARMAVVCSSNGLFRTVLDDSSSPYFVRTYASMWMYGNTWSGDYGGRREMIWPFYDACNFTTQASGRHLIAASYYGLFSINLANDELMDSGWVQIKDSAAIGSVMQVMPGGMSPTVYMLARTADGTVYRYGTDINTQSLTARRHLDTTASNTWDYVFRPINGKWMNISYGRHEIGASNKLRIVVDYGNHNIGNGLYDSYYASNTSFSTDNDGYFVIYDHTGSAHRFKIVDTTSPGSACSISNLQLQFATGDSWDASMFTRTQNAYDYTSDTGIFYPAGVRWEPNSSSFHSSTRFYINWFVRFNDSGTSMSLRYYAAGVSYTVDPSASDGSFSFYSGDGDALSATFDSSTEKLTVNEGVCWRDVNTLFSLTGVRLPAIDFIYSDSTGDYAFSGNKIYKSTNNAVTWTLADTLVDHCPFVHIKSGTSLCLAVDSKGDAFKSVDNGHSWFPYQSTTVNPRFDIVNGKWFSMGADKLMVSDDGDTWTDTSVVLSGVTCIKYGGSVYACSCPSGVYRSVDGIRWTRMSDRADVVSLSYEEDRWVASSADGILWSGDDPLFENHSIQTSPASGFLKVYNGSSYLIGCSSDLAGLWYSGKSGTMWYQSNIESGIFYDVTSNGSSIYVAVGTGGIYYGSSGASWTHVDGIDGVFYKVEYRSSRFVAVGTTGLFYSTNGSTWTSPFKEFKGITYGSYIKDGRVVKGLRWAAVNNDGLYYCNDASSWSQVSGTSGTFSSVSRTRNVPRGPFDRTGAYLIAYSSSQTWYAADTDVSTWTQFINLDSAKYTKVEKTSSGWLAARSSYLQYSTDGLTWTSLTSPSVGTIYDIWAVTASTYEFFFVAGSSGAAWSSDGGTTWTKFSDVSGSVKEIIPGIIDSSAGTYVSAILFLASGGAYAVNVYDGSSYTPVATKINVHNGVDNFIAIVGSEYPSGYTTYFHFQASDFTDYMVAASTFFYDRPMLPHTVINGLGAKLTGISIGGSRAVAITENGIYTSSKFYGTDYTWEKSSDISNDLVCIATAGSTSDSQQIFAAEASGKTLKSTDSAHLIWNIVSNGLSSSFSSVAHTGSKWIASGSRTVVSSNGVTWTGVSAGISDASAVCGNSSDLIVSGGSGYSYSSDAGSTWTQSTAIKGAVKIVYLNSLWYACTTTGLFTSPDMSVWTPRIRTVIVRDILLNGSQWVAVGNSGSTPCVWTSSDGLLWTVHTVSTSIPTFGSTLDSVSFSGSVYVVSGQAGTYVSSDLVDWTLASHDGIPVVCSIDECGDYLIACTSQGVYYSLDEGNNWSPTNLHSGNFYGAAHRKYSYSNTTDQITVAGSSGLFVAFKTRTSSELMFSAVSSEVSFMSLGFVDVIRGADNRWFAVSTSGLYHCSSNTVSGWARLIDHSFCNLTRDGLTIIASGADGIWCSQDGGSTWAASNLVSDSGDAEFSSISKVGSVWIASSSKDGIFAELAEDTRIYYSKDGLTWTLGAIDFGDYATELSLIAYGTNTVTDGSRLFTGITFSRNSVLQLGTNTNGVYYSDDCGVSWRLCSGTRGFKIRGIAYDSSSNCVYAFIGTPLSASAIGIWVSSDSGKTWRHVGTPEDSIYSAPFIDGALVKGYLWAFGSADSTMNLYRVYPGTGLVKEHNIYRSKDSVSPSQFDYDDWEEVDNPVRRRLFGGNTLCIPDITLYT